MKKIILKKFAKIIPRNLKKRLKKFKILAIEFGQWQSMKKNQSADNSTPHFRTLF